MAILKVEVNFKDGFKGIMKTKKADTLVGIEENELEPYDMFLGALATCLYSTFLDVMEKKRITFDESNVIITGEKRKEIPPTLKWVNVVIEVTNVSNEKGAIKSAELAKKYCSVYQTISKVADMDLNVVFI